MEHLCTSEYGYGKEHSVYIRVCLWYGTFCIHQSVLVVWNTVYTSAYGYGMEHCIHQSVVMVWDTLNISEYCNGMEHSVYIRVWLWYGTFCIVRVWLWYGTLHTSECGYGMGHPEYIRVLLWYGTFCIHQSVVMVWDILNISEYCNGMEHSV